MTTWPKFSLLWGALTSGRQKIVETFFAEHSVRFVLRRNEERAPVTLSPGRCRLLERVLLETDRKVVAAELGLSESTIHVILKQSLEFFGLSCAPAQVPPLLLLAARAASDRVTTGGRWSRDKAPAATAFSIASSPRPELALRPLLSSAEYEVIRYLIEGKSYAEIAALRRTAVRTVANQIAASFRVLGVSGRSHLLRRLLQFPALPLAEQRSRGLKLVAGARSVRGAVA